MPKVKVFKVDHRNSWDDCLEQAVVRDLSGWSVISESDLASLRAWARQKNKKAKQYDGYVVVVEDMTDDPEDVQVYIQDIRAFLQAEEARKKQQQARRAAVVKAKKKAAEQKKIEEAKKLLEAKGLLPSNKKKSKTAK